jgi:CheY-like chemotaxis protein
MALGIFYAISKARLITASLESLAGQVRHLAAGQRIADIPASRVVEIDRALAALEEASVLLQSTTQQRDRSLETEREARAAAEAASRAKDEFLVYQLARRLREVFGRQIVLIALTGYDLATDAEKAMQAGFDRHLTKPVDLQKLAQAIEIAGRSRQAASASD